MRILFAFNMEHLHLCFDGVNFNCLRHVWLQHWLHVLFTVEVSFATEKRPWNIFFDLFPLVSGVLQPNEVMQP